MIAILIMLCYLPDSDFVVAGVCDCLRELVVVGVMSIVMIVVLILGGGLQVCLFALGLFAGLC